MSSWCLQRSCSDIISQSSYCRIDQRVLTRRSRLLAPDLRKACPEELQSQREHTSDIAGSCKGYQSLQPEAAPMSSSGSKRPLDEGKGKKKSGKGGIRWDEQNLEENERIKKELNPRKIDEPKTPYLSPMDTDEEGDLGSRMRPLSLDDPAAAAAAAVAVATAAGAAGPSSGTGGTTSDEAGSSGRTGRGRGRHVRIGGRGWSDSDDRTVSPSPRHPDGASPGRSSRSPRFSDQYYGDHEQDDEEEEEANPQRQEKRRRFKEARKQHYNMREQLARARELMQSTEEEEGEGPAAAEVEAGGTASPSQRQQQQEQERQQPNGTYAAEIAADAEGAGPDSEGHLDADVESEHEAAGTARPRGSGTGGGGSGGTAGRPVLAAHPLPGSGNDAMSDDD